MILDHLTHAETYAAPGSRLALGFAWLKKFSPTLADGRHPIDGENVFALVQSYETVDPAQKKFEAHRNYLDIQYVASGYEVMQYAPITALQAETAYNAEGDHTLYRDPLDATALKVGPGCFAVFFPPDGHKPGCIGSRPERIRKVVIKVRL